MKAFGLKQYNSSAIKNKTGDVSVLFVCSLTYCTCNLIKTRAITKCDEYPHKTASEMLKLLVTEYLVKELK
jgi:hypothetical protein